MSANKHRVCAVATCKNPNHVLYHRFPTDLDQQKLWVNACRRKDYINPKTATICERHFTPESYQRDLKNELLGLPLKKRLKKDAVPTLALKTSLEMGQYEDSYDYNDLEQSFSAPDSPIDPLAFPQTTSTMTQCDIVSIEKMDNLKRQLLQVNRLLESERRKVSQLTETVQKLQSQRSKGSIATRVLRKRSHPRNNVPDS